MRKLLNNPWIVTALALAAVAFVGSSLWPSRPAAIRVTPERELAATESSAVETATTSEPVHTEAASAVKELPVASVLTDPFASHLKPMADRVEPEVVPETVDTVRLSAIWTQQGQTYILLNGQIHQAGDEISRIKIESATQDGVWVAHWKGRDFLTLGSDFTLVTPGQKASAGARL